MVSRPIALALVTVASTAAAGGKLAIKPFDIGDVAGDRGEKMVERFTGALEDAHVAVLKTTPALVKPLEACTRGAACAAKLGATGVVFGTVKRMSGGFQLTLEVTDETGAVIASRTGRTITEEQLIDLAALYGKELGDEVAPRWSEPVGTLRKVAWVPGALGLIGGAVGAGLFAQSRGTGSLLTDGARHTLVEAARARDQATLEQTIGVVAMCAGAALLLTAILLWAVGG